MWDKTEFGGFEEAIPFSDAAELMPNAAAVYTSGRGATLAVDKDGGLWAFNTAQFNETIPGVNADVDKDRMKPVKLMDGVAMAAIDQFHTLILMRDGTLWVEGFASFGAPWLGQTGAYLTKVTDDVIWVDLTSYGGYAVTSSYELWGWGFSHNEPRPEKLLDGVIQASSGHLALTPQGELLSWRYDYKTWTLTQPEAVFQHVMQFGYDFAITEDGSLWVCNGGISNDTAEKLMEHTAYAAQGELGILVLDRDGGLWLLRRDFDSGIYEKTKLT